MFQFGTPPEKKLSPERRDAIVSVLGLSASNLHPLFNALDGIITRYSLDAQPLADPDNRDQVRGELVAMRGLADKLLSALNAADPQTTMRLALSTIMAEPHRGPPDFPRQLLRFRDTLEGIENALAPASGGKAGADHLRAIVALCAIEYEKAVGEKPAKRSEGVFRRMMDIVLAQIDLSLPSKPDNILGPAIDAAFRAADEPDPSPK